MRTIAWMLRALFLVAEKIVSELALLAAIFSTTEGGSYGDRIVGGMMDNVHLIYGFGKSVVTDMKFSDFIAALKSGIDEGLSAVSSNVEMNPRQVILAMIATFAVWKAVSMVLRFLRKSVLRRGRERDVPAKRASRPEGSGGGKTYEQLYEQHPSHRPAQKQVLADPEE